MTAGLFLGLLLCLGCLLWIGIRQRQENILHATVIAATDCSVLVTEATSPHHPIVFVNPAFLSLTGYSQQEVIGRPTSILTGPDTDRASTEKLAMALQGGWACRVRVCHYRKNGTSFWSDISLSPVKDRLGRVTSVVWTMREVSDGAQCIDAVAHRQTEAALRESEARLDCAMQLGQIGLFEYDHRTDSLSWSPILRRIYGVGADAPTSWQHHLELVHPDDRDRMISAVQRTCASTGNEAIEYRVVRPDRAIRRIRLRSLTSFEGSGSSRQPIRTMGMVVDVTDQKNVEARRHETARMEAVGVFAGGIAHELNNGLTAVLGFSELALPLIPMESKAHRHIRHVIAATKKSRGLIQQLLAFSEQNDHNRCPLFLHVLVKKSLRFLRPAIPLWIELKAQIAHTTSPISANAVQMHEMMFYLIDGALRAMQQSGGTLDVQLQNRELGTDQIMPSGRLPAGRYVCLSVRGAGEGMDADKVGRWFTSFSTSKTFNEKQDVGLAVVSHIVSAHGGTLAVETHVGGGMTVSVYLPALSTGAPSTFGEDDPLPRGYESILFVDDEDAVVRFGKEVLESLGYHPVVCRTAAEAWDIFRVEPKQFDLLIIDRTMPGMSGDRLVRECRRLRPDLPVIFCSGSNDAPGLDDPCSRGFTEYLLKPLTLQELAYAIRRALDRSLLPPESTGSQASLGPEPSRRSIEVSNAVGPRG